MASTRRPFSPDPDIRTQKTTRNLCRRMTAKAMVAPDLKERTPVDEGWAFNAKLGMVTHSSDCQDCLSMCQHYVADAMDNNQTLAVARQARDDVLSRPLKTRVDGLERRRVETLQKLAALRQKISEARGKLAEARRDRARLVEADNKPRRRLADACEEERGISAPGPSSFQLRERPRPPSYPRPTDPSQTTEHETIYISSDSDDDVLLIPPAPNSRFLERD